ncbi:PAS domain-containing protein [Halosimplex aquaticum]|uniref:histidine kinase n=1 Tax=Halosimplex aquaticum TaxID=3026162 RepID=A0ABD5Y0R0_9EURY|nr:PAS domain-containing protein [Halosimplex aquaticum]
MERTLATGDTPVAESEQAVETFRVLHVDDEPDLSELASIYLERADDRFVVETATSASIALDKLSEEQFDCVISDYEMPGCNGIEFLGLVREQYSDLPFILFTGKGTEEIASDAISAGVTDYLQKQASTDQYSVLANTVSNAIEHYQSNQTVQQRNQQLQAVIKRVTDAIVEVDADWQFTLVNPQAEALYDMDEEDLLGRDFWEVFDGALDTRFEAEYRQVMDTREPTSFVEHFSQLNGTFDIEAYPMDNGGIAFYFTKVSEKLQKRTKQLQDIIDTVEGAVWIRNAEYEYVYMNQYHRDLFGIPDDVDVAGKQFADLLPAEVAAQFRENDDKVYETGEPIEIEEIVMIDDEPRDYLTRITPLFENGSVYATCGIATDITGQKTRERQLDQFTGIVSHDLRNPLNVATGRLELATDECDSEHLEHIYRAHNRMADLIDDLLTLARDGSVIAETTAVDLDSLINGCWTNVATADASLVADIERPVQADESRLKQVFENLIRNAIEHGGNDVTVTVGALADGFYVEDDGPGIPSDAQQDIFEAGYSTTEDGTGFGLSIVKQIVDAHGWSLRLTEGAMGGARFEITGVKFAA